MFELFDYLKTWMSMRQLICWLFGWLLSHLVLSEELRGDLPGWPSAVLEPHQHAVPLSPTGPPQALAQWLPWIHCLMSLRKMLRSLGMEQNWKGRRHAPRADCKFCCLVCKAIRSGECNVMLWAAQPLWPWSGCRFSVGINIELFRTVSHPPWAKQMLQNRPVSSCECVKKAWTWILKTWVQIPALHLSCCLLVI